MNEPKKGANKNLAIVKGLSTNIKLASEFDKRRADPSMMWGRELVFLQNRIQANPKLQACTAESFKIVMMQVAGTGLSLAPALGFLYVYPYGDVATLTIGYRGLEHIVLRSEAIRSIQSEVVYDEDPEFKIWTDETGKHFSHIQAREYGANAKVTHAYCLALFANGGHHIEVVPAVELEAAEAAATSRNSRGGAVWRGPWINEMRKKVAVRRGWKHWPKDSPLQNAMTVMEEIEPNIPEKALPAGKPEVRMPEAIAEPVETPVDDDSENVVPVDPAISLEQVDGLCDEIKARAIDLPQFLLAIESIIGVSDIPGIEEIPAAKYDEVLALAKKKKVQGGGS